LPLLGIGKNGVVDRAIIDKNARIGDGAVITPEGKPKDFGGENLFQSRRRRAEERDHSAGMWI